MAMCLTGAAFWLCEYLRYPTTPQGGVREPRYPGSIVGTNYGHFLDQLISILVPTNELFGLGLPSLSRVIHT